MCPISLQLVYSSDSLLWTSQCEGVDKDIEVISFVKSVKKLGAMDTFVLCTQLWRLAEISLNSNSSSSWMRSPLARTKMNSGQKLERNCANVWMQHALRGCSALQVKTIRAGFNPSFYIQLLTTQPPKPKTSSLLCAFSPLWQSSNTPWNAGSGCTRFSVSKNPGSFFPWLFDKQGQSSNVHSGRQCVTIPKI